METVKVEKLKPKFVDERGAIFDILTANIRHIGMITCKKGSIRGNHYHKIQTQYTYIEKGKLEMTTKDLRGKDAKPQTVVLAEGDLVTCPPMVIHAYRALEDSVFYDFTTLPREEGGYEADTFRVELVK